MKKMAVLLFSIISILSSLSQAQVQVTSSAELEKYLQTNSQLYAAFNQRENTKQHATEMMNSLNYRLSRAAANTEADDLVKSKGMLFCGVTAAGLILVKGEIYACEVFDIQGSKISKPHFLWAYSVDFKLRSDRSKILDTFKNIIGKGMSLLRLDQLFVLSGHVGLAMGYAWGSDYGDYDDLTLRKGFISTKFQVVSGWGAGLQIMAPKKGNDDLHVVLASVLTGGNSTVVGSKGTVKFRKGIQLKTKDY